MTLSVATEHPSDIFRQAVQSITATVMADLISCGKTHVYKQAAHPDRNGEARISFIEKAERMLTAIMIKNPMLAQTIAFAGFVAGTLYEIHLCRQIRKHLQRSCLITCRRSHITRK